MYVRVPRSRVILFFACSTSDLFEDSACSSKEVLANSITPTCIRRSAIGKVSISLSVNNMKVPQSICEIEPELSRASMT